MMKTQNIVILDSDTLGQDFNLESEFQNLGNLTIYGTTKNAEILSRIEKADIVITNKVVLNEQVLSKNDSVKLISVLATGLNNVDIDYTKKKGIIVKNVTDYSTQSVTQHTFTMLLHLIGKPYHFDHYVKSKQYSDQTLFTHIGNGYNELSNKTIGIIGLGNIGKNVAQVARSLGMKVQYYSTSGKNNHTDYNQCSLENLLSTSDIISIHAPLNDKTQNLISKNQLLKMKKTSILLNTGRGGIINEQDLANALNNNEIAAAGLDVFEIEPLPSDNPLLQIRDTEKLILTPHIAWASVESRKTLIQKTINNIKTFLENA